MSTLTPEQSAEIADLRQLGLTYHQAHWRVLKQDQQRHKATLILRRKVDKAASIDRFDNSKGYTVDNCWWISDRANRLKRDGTLYEFQLLVRAMRGRSLISETPK